MSYQIIQPPFTLKFEEMSKKELKEYFDWFHEIIPERIAELCEAVRQSPGYEDWSPDYSRESLSLLGNWFQAHVETQSRTPEETEELTSQTKWRFPVGNSELTNRTFSLAMDVGIYLSQVFLRNHPHLKWDQPLRAKKFIDYGQPVLVGFGPAPFNPVRMVVTLAYGFAKKKGNGARLLEIYDYWSDLAEKNKPRVPVATTAVERES
jgi:hypothetical protein